MWPLPVCRVVLGSLPSANPYCACCAQSPLAGFSAACCYLLVWPDYLYQTLLGTEKHIVNLLIKELHAGNSAAVNAQLTAIPPHPDLRLPKGCLRASKMYYQQVEALFRCLPVALLAADLPWPGPSSASSWVRVFPVAAMLLPAWWFSGTFPSHSSDSGLTPGPCMLRTCAGSGSGTWLCTRRARCRACGLTASGEPSHLSCAARPVFTCSSYKLDKDQ